METSENVIKSLEVKIKALEIENEKLASTIELNNKEIKEYKSLIQSLRPQNTANSNIKNENELIFKWKVSELRNKLLCELKNDFKTIKKISGDNIWNCTAIGDTYLIKGKINKWKIKVNNINPNPSHLLIGIIPSNIDLNRINNYAKGYCTNFDNFGLHNLRNYTVTFNFRGKKDDIVEIIVDLEKGQLSYSLNDIDLGVFCDNIDKNIDYVHFVEMYHIGTEITLI